MLFLPSLVGEQNESDDLGDVYRDVFLSVLGQIPGLLLAAYLVDKSGRRVSLGIYLLGASIASMGFNFALSSNSQAVLILVMAMIRFFMEGSFALLYTSTVEIYPTRLRCTGLGACQAFNDIAGIVSPFAGIYMKSGIAPAASIALYAGSFFISSIVAFSIPRETKDAALD